MVCVLLLIGKTGWFSLVGLFIETNGETNGAPNGKGNMDGEKLSRRGFACRLAQVAVGGAAAARTLVWAQGDVEERLIVDLSEDRFAPLREVGGAVKVEVDGQYLPVIVVRVKVELLVAYSSECTHWGCEVDMPDEQGIVYCPCHASSFDLRGKLIDGSAAGDLESIAVEMRSVSTAVESNSWGRLKQGNEKRGRGSKDGL